ncbi:MAG: hypothetical protein JWN14_1596, partial [Chthonomonadales bacterium]|nr:hypothetical protein [Chthonomonadales bacterium]
ETMALYSIGSNRKDDGGKKATPTTQLEGEHGNPTSNTPPAEDDLPW